MRLTEAYRLALTCVVATAVLGAATVAGSGRPPGPTEPGRLGSGSAAAVVDTATPVPNLPAGPVRVRGVKGMPLLTGSAFGELDIPVVALLAYQGAAAVMERVDRRCGLSWTLLAAIGRVESDHGRYAGAELLNDGTSSERIRGVALDGAGPVARIRDTDAGLVDGDRTWDRAVGPMQFLPSTWSVVAVDGDGDGVRSPDDLDDAALAAAVLLCSGRDALDSAAGRRTAVFGYNPSRSYVSRVLAVERAYRAGEFDIPGASAPTLPAGTVQAVRPLPAIPDTGGASGPQAEPDGGNDAASPEPPDGPEPDPDAEPDPTDTPGPTDPGPDPDPTDPTETPDPTDPPGPDPSDNPDDPDEPDPTDPPDPPVDPAPEPVLLTGVLTACGEDLAEWCLDDLLLDVGDAEFLAAPAGADLDADGVVETRADEIAGLVDTEVTLLVTPDTDPAFVVGINDLAYDGR